jgi:methionine sulfoxide reductase heme-binding subunit
MKSPATSKPRATGPDIRFAKTFVWALCLLPLLLLLWKGFTDGLGANPIEYITLSTGTWTLVLLLITLGITPARKLTGQLWLIKLRRLTGLFAFFYLVLHFTTYVWLDKFFDVREMLNDVVKRPFITAGFAAFVLLVPLAATSTAASIRRLGGRKWQLLHRLIYLSAALGVLHFWWKVKADTREPAIYAAVLGILLAHRVFGWAVRNGRRANHGKKAPATKYTSSIREPM